MLIFLYHICRNALYIKSLFISQVSIVVLNCSSLWNKVLFDTFFFLLLNLFSTSSGWFSQSLIKFIPLKYPLLFISHKKVILVESMEEEAATTRGSLLLKQKLDNNDQWSSSDHGGMQLSESLSTTTPIVVLSTLVAVCGSFTFGSAVSTITILFLMNLLLSFFS